jgi:tetratricopeptide (TPR) repeat protein
MRSAAMRGGGCEPAADPVASRRGRLELQGEAAWWSGRPDAATDALERAFAGHLAADHPLPAARVALLLTYLAFRRLAESIGAGWLARAERLLETAPESGTHAWLQVLYAVMALMQIRLSDAVGHADRAIELARDHGNPDAQALALSFKGMAEIARGRWQEGLSLIDEAAAAATSGQIGIRYARTSTATRSPPAATWAITAGPGSGPMRPSAGCCASQSAAIRESAGFIEPS